MTFDLKKESSPNYELLQLYLELPTIPIENTKQEENNTEIQEMIIVQIT